MTTHSQRIANHIRLVRAGQLKARNLKLIANLPAVYRLGVTDDDLLVTLSLVRGEISLGEAWDELSIDVWTFIEAVNLLQDDDTALHCSACGTPHWSMDGQTLYSGDPICEGCRSEFAMCNRCDELFDRDDVTNVEDDYYCDRRCRDYVATWCEECDEWYLDDTGHDSHEDEDDCGCEAPNLLFRFPANGHGTVREDERLAVEMPAGTISNEGLYAISQLIFNETQLYTWDLVGALEPVWVAKRGNFTRRLSTALHKQLNVKLPAGLLSEIGNLARRHTTDESGWHVEFTRDLNLPSTEFYHGSSCWWGGYSRSRCALKNWGGLAIRSFAGDSNRPSGRAWIQPLGEDMEPTHDTTGAHAYVVYNGYGDLDGYAPARLVAHLTSKTYRRIDLGFEPQFVNGEVGYLVADEATCETTSSVSYCADEHTTHDHRHHALTMEMAA